MARNDKLAAMTGAAAQFFQAINAGKDPYAAYDRVLQAYQIAGEGLKLQGQMKELAYKEKMMPIEELKVKSEAAEADERAKRLKADREEREALKTWYQEKEGRPIGADELEEVMEKVKAARLKRAEDFMTHTAKASVGGYEAEAKADVGKSQQTIAESGLATKLAEEKKRLQVPEKQAEQEVKALDEEQAYRLVESEIAKNSKDTGLDKPKMDFFMKEIGGIEEAIANIDKIGTPQDITSSAWYQGLSESNRTMLAGMESMRAGSAAVSPADKKAAKDRLIAYKGALIGWASHPSMYPEFPWGDAEAVRSGIYLPSRKVNIRTQAGTVEPQATTVLPEPIRQSLNTIRDNYISQKRGDINAFVEVLKDPQTKASLLAKDVTGDQIDAYIQELQGTAISPDAVSKATPKQSGKWKYQPVNFKASDIKDRTELHRTIASIAGQYGIEPEMVLAFAKAESDLGRRQKFDSNGNGIMQVSTPTGRDQFGYSVNDLKDPSKNINAGVAYLGYLKAMGANTIDQLLNGYLAGPDNINNPDIATSWKYPNYAQYKNNINNAYKSYKSYNKNYQIALDILLQSMGGKRQQPVNKKQQDFESELHRQTVEKAGKTTSNRR